MASYIQGVQDLRSQQSAPPLPTSNYSFLQSQMDKANAMYESGLQDVKSGYMSIVNAPVTGIEANERKQRYLQEAQNKLKTLSSKDLSLPQNVVQAEAAYAPFWEDNMLVTNSAYTRRIDKELNRLDGWLYSTDANTRAMYNDKNKEALQIISRKLGESPMNQQAYGALSRDMGEARAIPYYDIDKEIEESWKNTYGTGADKGYGATKIGGGAMVTQYNGPESFQAYKTWYMTNIGNEKYAPQLRQQTWVEVQNRREQVLRQHPGIAPDQVDNILAKDRMTELQAIGAEKIRSYTGLIDMYGGLIDDMRKQQQKQNGNLSDTHRVQLGIYQGYLESYTKLNEDTKLAMRNYTELDANGRQNPEYYKTLTDIATNPVGYIQNINMDRSATRWAEGRASITSPAKIEVDPIEKEQWDRMDKEWGRRLEGERIRNERARIAQEDIKIGLTKRGQDIDLWKTTGIKPDGTIDPRLRNGKWGWAGSGTASWDGGTNIPEGTVSEYTINPVHLDMLSRVNESIETPRNTAVGIAMNITDNTGFGTIVLGQDGMKLSTSDMNIFTEYMNVMMREGKVPPNAEQGRVWNNVKNTLKEQGIIKNISDITGPMTMYGALKAYGNSKIASGLNGKPSDISKDKLAALSTQIDLMNNYMDQHNTARENFDKDIESKMLVDSRFKDMVIEEGGKKRLVTDRDISNGFPTIVIEDRQGNKRTVSKEEQAQSWMDGTYKDKYLQNGNRLVQVGNKKITDYTHWIPKLNQDEIQQELNKYIYGTYNTTSTAHQPLTLVRDDSHRWDNIAPDPNSVIGKFGSAGKLGKLRELASGEIASTMNLKDGVIYKMQSWDPNDEDEDTQRFTAGLAKEMAPISNTTSLYVYEPGSNVPKMLDVTKDAQLIADTRSILSSTSETKENIASISVIPGLNEVAVTFKPVYSAKEHTPAYANKTVYMKLTPNAQGKLLKSLPTGVVSGPFAGLYSGKEYKSSNALKQAGIDDAITPVGRGIDGQPTHAIWDITMYGIDPNTLQDTSWSARQTYDLSKTTANELYNLRQSTINAFNAQQSTARNARAQKIAASPK